MPTITLSDACYNELKAALTAEQPGSPRPTPPVTPTPPAQPPSGDWQAVAREAAARQGYDPAIVFEWSWPSGVVFDTATRGSVRERGVVIASFIATGPEDGVLAQVDAIGYPAPNQGNQLSLSLSTAPCDFTVAEPAISISDGPSIVYCVGKPPTSWWNSKPTAVGLVPGQRYFINCSGRDSFVIGDRPGEFRLALRVPQGH